MPPEPPTNDPRAGGAASASEHGPGSGELHCVELCPICRTADLLRAAGGAPELRGQLDDVSREALLTLRSLIDHYLERRESDREGRGRVEQIPID